MRVVQQETRELPRVSLSFPLDLPLASLFFMREQSALAHVPGEQHHFAVALVTLGLARPRQLGHEPDGEHRSDGTACGRATEARSRFLHGRVIGAEVVLPRIHIEDDDNGHQRARLRGGCNVRNPATTSSRRAWCALLRRTTLPPSPRRNDPKTSSDWWRRRESSRGGRSPRSGRSPPRR